MFLNNKFEDKDYRYERGMTIIELVVVMAIVIILSSIIAVNIISSLARGKESAIKGNMHSIASGATVFFDNEKKWDNVFNPANNPSGVGAMNAVNKILSPATVLYNLKTDNSSWCACSNLIIAVNGVVNTYCVDSQGYRRETENPCSARCTVENGLCSN